MVNNYLEMLLDQLAPCACQLCAQASDRGLALCDPCLQSLASNSRACPHCALPCVVDSALPCGQCQQRPPAFSSATVPYLYVHPLDGFIKQLKFSAGLHQLPVLAELMSGPVARALHLHGRPDKVVPVPLHWRRQWRRGFNQASQLALQLCRHPLLQAWSLQVDDRLCTRRRATAAQHGLERSQRQLNIARAFVCSAGVSGLHLAIVDDVMTTGATVEALAREFLRQGASRVDVWCCARTPPPTD
jgi:ComF family protein